MLRQLRQRLRREMCSDGVILHRSAEFVAYLLINRIDNLLTGEHGKTYRGLPTFVQRLQRGKRGCKQIGALPRHSFSDGGLITFLLVSIGKTFR